MSLWDRFTSMMAAAPHDYTPVLETRSDPPAEDGSLADLIARIQGAREMPWRVASLREAMSVPSIFRAVTLISNIMGSLTLRAFQRGIEMPEADRPRLIVRPNPFTTPREFFRETGWSMAALGEAWWWVAVRDFDGMPMSLIPVDPREIVVTENEKDLRYPKVEWRNRTMGRDEMIQIKMSAEPGALRGKGPLQMCGAAVSVAVEAQMWAANYFSEGGIPSIVIKTAGQMTETDATAFLAQWMEKAHNQPRIIDSGVESVQEFGVNQQSAQMFTARDFQNGEAARMYGIPGGLLMYGIPGSSIVYQNVGDEFAKFLRVCLLPDYLEPVEQAMSDQLTRSTVSRFNTEALERADIKTLYEVAGMGMDKGIFTDQNEARAVVGLAPSLENAPMPLSPPQAIPASLPIQTRQLRDLRCAKCNRLAGRIDGAAEIKCERCGQMVVAAA